MQSINLQVRASQQLELAALHLYRASEIHRHEPLPPWDSPDVEDMRHEYRHLAVGALWRGHTLSRFVAVERVAIVLATANGDLWPKCDNQIHRGLPEERRAVLAAMRRQRYRHQARLVCSEVARFYEMDDHIHERMQAMHDKALAQIQADRELVTGYKQRIGQGEVVAIGVRE